MDKTGNSTTMSSSRARTRTRSSQQNEAEVSIIIIIILPQKNIVLDHASSKDYARQTPINATMNDNRKWPNTYNAEGFVVDNGFFRLSIWRSVRKIFAIKVESCQKLRRILDIFSPSQILGAGLPKIVPALTPLTCGTSTGTSFMGILPLDPKL